MKKTIFIQVFLTLMLTAPVYLQAESFDETTLVVQVGTYDQLISAIRGVQTESRIRVEKAVEKERVREAWETGRLIDVHVLRHKERAEYAKQVMKRLAADLGMSRSELYFMLEFYRTYPIVQPVRQLSWSHYVALLAINDDEEREALAEQAEKEGWSRSQLRREIEARKTKGDSPFKASEGLSPLKTIESGLLDTYQIVRLKDRLMIDLGFGIYRDLPEGFDVTLLKEGDMVASAESKEGFTLSLVRCPVSDLYTYTATVESVVDGDTFHALIDLGFETIVAQRVRLRSIDAPEILTAEGKEARTLLKKILDRDKGRILLQSHELDQYGRPLADVWVLGKSVEQELVDEGLAVIIDG